MGLKQILVKDLPEVQKNYLMSLPTEGKNGMPVYYRDETGEVFFVSDYVLYDNRLFEKTAVEGLYRGGALMKLLTKNGQVVLYDERPNAKWLRLVGGIARYSEGDDLTKTAVREAVVEELAVLADNEKVRLVPAGTKDMVGLLIPGWDITVEGILETGSLSVVGHFFNEVNHAYEVVVQWDISGWDNLIIVHSEDWFRGGRSGFAPLVINGVGDVIGLYDGRHGYMPLPVWNTHPTLEAILKL